MAYSTRNMDYIIEKITNEFEDKYFWPRKLGDKLSCLARYTDTAHQFAGIDFTLKDVAFDEKVKYYGCLNGVCDMPGFELSFRNGIGDVQDGWLVANNLSTQYYSIVGLSATTNDIYALSSSQQITGIDILWIYKKELIDYINQLTPIKQIIDDARQLRADSDTIEGDEYDIFALPITSQRRRSEDGKYRHRYEHSEFWLTYSSHLKEQPVNLVIPRETLLKFKAKRHFVVTREYIKDNIID